MAYLESGMEGPSNECSYAPVCLSIYVCKCMRKNLNLNETPMYFRNFGYLLIILLLYVY